MADHGPRIHFSISSHGYGHLTQSIALLKAITEQMPEAVFCIQCNLPEEIIAQRLGHNNFRHIRSPMDVALIQKDPISVDKEATYLAYSSLHENYYERVIKEAEQLKQWCPDLIISDIAYLPIAAANHAGIPTIALASLTWDKIIEAYFDLNEAQPAKWYAEARTSYAEARLALLPEPAMNGDCFTHIQPIPPIALPGNRQSGLRSLLNIKANDRRPLILCSLGGIAGAKMPLSMLKKQTEFHWLINTDFTGQSENIHHMDNCASWPYSNVVASVDGIVSKPGYGMAVEASANGLPFVFFRRGHFPDEPCIIDWLHKTTRAIEISASDWAAGEFIEPLIALLDSPAPEPPRCNGAEVGAQAIKMLMNSWPFKKGRLIF